MGGLSVIGQQQPLITQDRVAIFIDAENLRNKLKALKKDSSFDAKGLAWRLLQHLPKPLGDNSSPTLTRMHVYGADSNDTEGSPEKNPSADFLSCFEGVPYTKVVRGFVRGKKRRQKAVDVLLAVDMVLQAAQDKYDTAILIAGDLDFQPAVEAVQELKKYVIVCAQPHSISQELQDTSDGSIEFRHTHTTVL